MKLVRTKRATFDPAKQLNNHREKSRGVRSAAAIHSNSANAELTVTTYKLTRSQAPNFSSNQLEKELDILRSKLLG